MDGVVFADHTLFPGPVSAAAPRLQNATFTIDGDYQTNPGYYLNGQEMVIRPTGYYAPPGELVEVVVPAAVVNQNLVLFFRCPGRRS